MVPEVPDLNLVAGLQMDQPAGVASVGFRDLLRGVRHRGALILGMIVQLDNISICVVLVGIEDLVTKIR